MRCSCCARRGSTQARESGMGPNEEVNRSGIPEELVPPLRDWRRRSTGCPPPDRLQAANEGVVPSAVAETVLRHLESCRTCKSLLQDLASLGDALVDLDQQQRIRRRIGHATQRRWDSFSWLMRPWPAAAIAAAALVLIG